MLSRLEAPVDGQQQRSRRQQQQPGRDKDSVVASLRYTPAVQSRGRQAPDAEKAGLPLMTPAPLKPPLSSLPPPPSSASSSFGGFAPLAAVGSPMAITPSPLQALQLQMPSSVIPSTAAPAAQRKQGQGADGLPPPLTTGTHGGGIEGRAAAAGSYQPEWAGTGGGRDDMTMTDVPDQVMMGVLSLFLFAPEPDPTPSLCT